MSDATPRTTQTELRKLLKACRLLMREILTVSHADRGAEHQRFLSAATRQVEEATRCVRDFESQENPPGEVERLASNLAKLYLEDMLGREERRYATAAKDPNYGQEGFQGYTWAISIPDLLSFLQIQGKTGTLRVNLKSEVISLALSEGDLVNAYSDNSPPGLRLGEILVRQGKIEMELLERFLAEFEIGTEPLGEALERAGLISREGLQEALELQIRLIFVRLLRSEEAHFRFENGPVQGPRPARYSIMQLLLDACRLHDEVKEKKKVA